MRLLVLLILALLATTASAAAVQVSPGPGTPLQDAIDAAAPHHKLVVHTGNYPEAIVIDRPLAIVVDQNASIGSESGSQSSDCTSAFQVDITTPGPVTLQAKGGRNVQIRVNGGSVAAIRVGAQANVRMVKVSGLSWCDGAGGLVIDPQDSRRDAVASIEVSPNCSRIGVRER